MSKDANKSNLDWARQLRKQIRLWELRVSLVLLVIFLIAYVLTESRVVDKTGRRASSFMLSPLLHPLSNGWSTSAKESPLPAR